MHWGDANKILGHILVRGGFKIKLKVSLQAWASINIKIIGSKVWKCNEVD